LENISFIIKFGGTPLSRGRRKGRELRPSVRRLLIFPEINRRFDERSSRFPHYNGIPSILPAGYDAPLAASGRRNRAGVGVSWRTRAILAAMPRFMDAAGRGQATISLADPEHRSPSAYRTEKNAREA